MDKITMVHPYNGILLTAKSRTNYWSMQWHEWISDALSKGKSQSPKAVSVWWHLNNILKKAKLLGQKTDQWLPRLEVTTGGIKEFWGVTELQYLDGCGGYKTAWAYQNLLKWALERVNRIVCKLRLSRERAYCYCPLQKFIPAENIPREISNI